jgi:hypothetical protein
MESAKSAPSIIGMLQGGIKAVVLYMQGMEDDSSIIKDWKIEQVRNTLQSIINDSEKEWQLYVNELSSKK